MILFNVLRAAKRASVAAADAAADLAILIDVAADKAHNAAVASAQNATYRTQSRAALRWYKAREAADAAYQRAETMRETMAVTGEAARAKLDAALARL